MFLGYFIIHYGNYLGKYSYQMILKYVIIRMPHLIIHLLTLLKLILLYYVDFIHTMFEISCVYVFNSNFTRTFFFLPLKSIIAM
jgi:hypothetical protein